MASGKMSQAEKVMSAHLQATLVAGFEGNKLENYAALQTNPPAPGDTATKYIPYLPLVTTPV